MDSKIVLGKYRIAAEEIEAVGEPADSALAYEAEEIDSGKTVVVEVVPAVSLKPAVRERLEAEALAAKKLNHVNIPALYDFGVEDDNLVYVTEDFEGTLAEAWVNLNGPMPVGPVLRIASQVVSALGAAAFHRIAHRALNPTNLVLVPGQTAEGEWPLVKVLHFVGGTAKLPGSDVAVAAFDQALPYASPEQLQGGVVDFRSEIYSLGCTMWFLLTGTPPLMTPNGPVAPPPTKAGPASEKIGALPKRVEHLLAQMLSINPDARPHDPLAFYRQLQDCLTQVEGREAAAAPPPRVPVARPRVIEPPRPRRSLKTLSRAAIVLALAALTALVLRGYLQHGRIVRAEEPIGVPIGVTDAFASATPVAAKPADTMASMAAPTAPVLADANSTQSVPAETTEPDQTTSLPSAADSGENASANQVPVAPLLTTSDPPASPPPQEPASGLTNNVSPPPVAVDSLRFTAAVQAEVVPAPAKSRDLESSMVAPQTSPKKTLMREVRRAELVEEPEVRRAEPAPPEESPAQVGPEPVKTTSRPAKPKNLAPRITPTPAEIKTEKPVKPQRRANDTIYLPRPVR